MDEIIHVKSQNIAARHEHRHGDFEFYKREVVPKRENGRTCVAVYEIPPGKSDYPYHYHLNREETFFIQKGSGTVRTPSGERPVSEGDFLFFPAGEAGCHRLTNTSGTEPLVYIEFGTHSAVDVVRYPDSGKVGIHGADGRQMFRERDQADYYDGE